MTDITRYVVHPKQAKKQANGGFVRYEDHAAALFEARSATRVYVNTDDTLRVALERVTAEREKLAESLRTVAVMASVLREHTTGGKRTHDCLVEIEAFAIGSLAEAPRLAFNGPGFSNAAPAESVVQP